MSGHEGIFIKFEYCDIDDSSMNELASRIIPLASNVLKVKKYMIKHQERQFGVVQHSFCRALSSMIRDHNIFVAQLETQLLTGQLTLHRLWFFCQNSIARFEHITRLIALCDGQIGGRLITIVYNEYISTCGDNIASMLLTEMLEKMSVPYFEMIEQWIYRGIVVDTYNEFCIVKQDSIEFVGKWRVYNAPVFLESCGQRILDAGKYLNILLESGETIENPVQEKFEFTSKVIEYGTKVESAYLYASEKLVDVLMKKEKLIERLNSIKQVFLMENGEFYLQFVENSEVELSKPYREMDIHKMDNLLQISLRDQFKQDFSCLISEDKNSKIGFDVFTLDYKAKWPLSLLLNQKGISQYAVIFKHLFYLKYIESGLNTLHLKRAGSLVRFNLLQLLNQYQNWFISDVVDKNHQSFMKKMNSIKTMEDIFANHTEFLSAMMDGLNLHLGLVKKILNIALSFSKMFSGLDANVDEKLQSFETMFGSLLGEIKDSTNSRFIDSVRVVFAM